MSIEAEIPISLADNEIKYGQQSQLGWVPFECIATVTAAANTSVDVVLIPNKHLVERVVLKAQTVGASPVGGLGTHLGIGILGDLDYFGEAIEASIDNSDEFFTESLAGAPRYMSTTTNLLLAATTTGGVAAGTLTGTWLVHISGRAWFGFA